MDGPATDFSRHGGRLDDAMRAWPHAPRPWLDLSTGINPVAWVPPAYLAIDPGPLPTVAALRTLEAAAAAHFGVAAERVAAVPGSEVALRLIRAIGLPGPVVCARPSYGTHVEVAARQAPAAALLADGGIAGTLLLANPNNPDGRVLEADDLLRRAHAQAAAGGWLAVDEAFADVSAGSSIGARIGADAPVVVFRSFGKFFGLAGVRLGFVIAPEPVLVRLRGLLGDWPVSAQAIAWGTAAYADAAWIGATRSWLAEQAAALDALLARHGLTARGECPLFRLIEHDDAGGLFARLAGAGILVRPFAAEPRWLRFGLPGDAAAMSRLDAALG
ncbi:aminotransferase class I/II-fold pyridoxal phosphate-dependent enzyme [Sphingomonas jatrophae]|uniref:L-threonine O-3-phosphate decarboxylase n=1 Tax=Sphingomonas jatrophae TaxID=1166337 RepID=A0A1I6JBR3_9SPHN|nr:aminotransferase class I/II-fold pyridoxal phosphate-dependent enzyme [Sphingomonas jatrophae]SFR76376.1 L-threonine O-3-phosphate decarboxylase [Sphingomonas jatrophae]